MLNATFGSIVELILYVVALVKGEEQNSQCYFQLVLSALTGKPSFKSALVIPLPNKLWFLYVCSTSFLKTLLEKEKLLITWPFCHIHQIWNGRLQTLSIWKSLKFVFWEKVKLTLFQTTKFQSGSKWKHLQVEKDLELKLWSKRAENIVGKGENAGYQHFLIFPQCFQRFFLWTC